MYTLTMSCASVLKSRVTVLLCQLGSTLLQIIHAACHAFVSVIALALFSLPSVPSNVSLAAASDALLVASCQLLWSLARFECSGAWLHDGSCARRGAQWVEAARRERTRANTAKRNAEAALLEVQQYEPPSDAGEGLGDLQSEIRDAEEDVERRLRPMVSTTHQRSPHMSPGS